MLNDLRNRMRFCYWARIMILQNLNFFRYVMFSNETTFKNIGELNRYNSYYWSDVNLYWQRGGRSSISLEHQRMVRHPEWLFDWFLFFWGKYQWQQLPCFFWNKLPVLLEDVDFVTRARMWIQLNGAPLHNYNLMCAHLNECYRGRWIGPHGPIAWSARSPDLTPAEFYL